MMLHLPSSWSTRAAFPRPLGVYISAGGGIAGCLWRMLRARLWVLLHALAFFVALRCSNWSRNSAPTTASFGLPQSFYLWAAEASTTGFDGRFLGRQITTDALRQGYSAPAADKHPVSDDEFLEDEEPLEIWGDLDDRRMILSSASCTRTAALRQAFNAALRILVDRGVRNQLLLKYKLPLSYAVELQGAPPAWPRLQELHEDDLLREVLEGRVLRVARVVRGSHQDLSLSSFNGSFLREIVDEIDLHYSSAEGHSDFYLKKGTLPIQIDYVEKASTAVVLQALDAGQAHMTDINMVLSHNPFNGITQSSRYSRSDQVMTQSTVVIVKSDTNIASLPALRDSIFMSFDQEGRTVVVDSTWNHQSLARVLPPYTIYELLSEGVPGAHLVDVLMDEEAVAATAQWPLPRLNQGLRQFAAGATFATGALFLMDRHGSRCPASTSTKSSSASSATPATPPPDKLTEDPALSSLRKELTKKSPSFSSYQKYYMSRGSPMWGRPLGSETPPGSGDNEDSYPATPGPWVTVPSHALGETELFDSLRIEAGEPLAAGRRYLRTRALHDSYNAAVAQLMRNAVLENLLEDLQEINIVPFFDCGGTVPGSVARSFPPPQRIAPDDALTDILRTGVVLVGMPMENNSASSSPEVLYAQRAMVEVVAAIGAEYRIPLHTRFIRFPSAQHALRALHKGLIHLADARILFEYISPNAHLRYRVRPTCALGASRLWMVTQNKEGVTSLEELHQALEENLDAMERRVGVLDIQLQSIVAGVLPPGVIVMVMTVQEAAEALTSRSITAVFGMATQQRGALRSLLNLERKTPEREERARKGASDAALSATSIPISPASSPEGLFPGIEAVRDDRAMSQRAEGPQRDGPSYLWPDVTSRMQYTDDMFQELMKAEGLQLDLAEIPHPVAASWIEVDTGVTAVMHPFLAASLRLPRPS